MSKLAFYNNYRELHKGECIKKLKHPTAQNIKEFCTAYGINCISIIQMNNRSEHYFPNNSYKNCINLVKSMLQNKNMWLIVFEEMCNAILINVATLRKLNYFDAFIRQYKKENLGDSNCYNIPNGGHIYCLSLDKDPFTQILYYSTFTSIEKTFAILNDIPLSRLADSENKRVESLDTHFIEAFNGIRYLELQPVDAEETV